MASKHRLTIPDIEDEEDLQERRKLRKLRKKNTVKLSFLEDDLEPPVMLHKKVKHVESRMDGVIKLDDVNGVRQTNDLKSDNKNLNEENVEDLPAIVESEELKSEALVDSIPRIIEKSRVLIRQYEQLKLHHLFLSVEENCKFRLFLYAVAYGYTSFWPQEKLMPSILRRILTMESVDQTLKSEGIVANNYSTDNGGNYRSYDSKRNGKLTVVDPLARPKFPIVRHCDKIEVPTRVIRLLP